MKTMTIRLHTRFRAFSFPLAGAALLILLGLSPGTAGAMAPSAVLPARPAAGPNLSDLSGWNQPGYYSTLQTADIDGDGQNEILARGKDGLHAWQLIRGAWGEVGRLTALSDAAGWNDASFYQTIQFAHLQTGNRQMDLIARASDGIHVWRYDVVSRSWNELGAAVQRPLGNAKAAAGGTDWTQPAHYTNIFVGDVNHDGVDELIARGQEGLQIYSWQAATSSWQLTSQSGPLADADGLVNRSSYLSVQFVSLQGEGQAAHSYVVARTTSGVQLLEWQSGSWHVVSPEGPFTDESSASAPGLLMSVRTYVDPKGQLWLFGLVPQAEAGAAIAVYRWETQSGTWVGAGVIPLAGQGWDRPSQYLTLRAGDFWGDGQVELLARAADGMHVYQQSSSGEAASSRKRSWHEIQVVGEMSDAHGYGLASSYYTIQTVHVNDDDGSDKPGTVLLGRGPRGVELYHNVGGQLTASTPLPNWLTDNQKSAYAMISQGLTGGSTSDIRSTYDVADDDYTYWKLVGYNLTNDYQKPPASFPSPNDWTYVYQQLNLEFMYVAAARAWFQNNTVVVNYIFNGAALSLTQVQNDESIQQSSAGSGARVALNWAQLVAQIANQILGTLAGPEAGVVSGLLQDGLQLASDVVAGGNNNIQAAVDNIASKVNLVQQQYTTSNAQQVTQYVTDWNLLKKIGVNSTGPNATYEWGQGTTVEELAAAENSGEIGQLLWMYKRVSNPAWHVYSCNTSDWIFGGCLAQSSYDSRYISNQYYDNSDIISFTTYTVIRAYMFPYPSFDALTRLTQTYHVEYNDITEDCDGWETDDPISSYLFIPNDCPRESSSLTASQLPQTLTALSALRDRVKQEGGAASRGGAATVDAAIDYVNRHSQYEVAQYGGAPNAADIAKAKAESMSSTAYVDQTVPVQFLTSLVGIEQLNPDVGAEENSVVSQAYNLIGTLNDDGAALAGLGQANN